MEANSPDVTLEFRHWLARARRGFNRLSWIHDVESLHAIEIWDFGEEGAFFHRYETQHESVNHTAHEFPASMDFEISYYDGDKLPLDRPVEPHFAKRSATYPLRESRNIFTCPGCSGTGQVKCSSCSGGGKCSSCGGDGRDGGKRCSSCAGDGRCRRCQGTGKEKCGRCKGEGRLLNYDARIYKWWHDTDDGVLLREPVDRRAVRRLIRRVRKASGSVRVEEFSTPEIERTTGIVNPRIESLVSMAVQRAAELEATIRGRSHLVVFQRIERQYSPLAYLNVCAGRKFSQFFAAGTEVARVMRPSRTPYSPQKLGGWFGVTGVAALATLTVASGAVLPVLASGAIGSGLAGLAALGARKGHLERRREVPPHWLVFDTPAHLGWQFAYLLAQAVSRARVGRIPDPWFTSLLEPPRANTVESRNSFTFTIRHSALGSARDCEVTVLANRAQVRYAEAVKELTRDARRLIWIVGDHSAESLDDAMRETLGRLASESRSRLDVTVVADDPSKLHDAVEFPRARAALGSRPLRVLRLSFAEMVRAASTGVISPRASEDFASLVDYWMTTEPPLSLPPSANDAAPIVLTPTPRV